MSDIDIQDRTKQRPAWIEPWTAGDWRAEVEANPTARAAYIRWYVERPASVQRLHLRFPVGTVVRLRDGTAIRPLQAAIPIHEMTTRPIWQGGVWAIVIGYIEPNAGAPEGGLILNDAPRTDPGDGWVHVGDVEAIEGHLRGYGPVQAREHVDELLGMVVELVEAREAVGA